MSRTFRVKHAEAIVAKHDYHKVAGVYSERDYVFFTGYGHPVLTVWREPNKKERRRTFLMLHGDGSGFFRSMKKWARKTEHKRHRSRNQRLIEEFLKGKTEDVVHESMPRYPWQY